MSKEISDEEKLAEFKKKKKLDDDQLMADLAEVLGTPSGLRIFKLILSEHNLYGETFANSGMEVYKRAAIRDRAVELFKLCRRACKNNPALLLKLIELEEK